MLMGGRSAERVISLESGTAVLRALCTAGVDAVAVDVDADPVDQLRAAECDRVFVALHGRGGEDGQLQGALQLLGLPYTGSGVLGSALAMDKLRTKRVWNGAGLATPASVEIDASTTAADVIAALGLPLMVKPAREGSSLGISRVKTQEEFPAAVAAARALDSLCFAEQYIAGGEYTAPLLDDDALPLIRLETEREFYDYEAKYHDTGTRYLCPCGLDARTERSIQDLALQAFRTLDGAGWGRIDLMLDASGKPWLIEANTVPGMTSHSLVPMSAQALGIAFPELCLRILETSFTPRP